MAAPMCEAHTSHPSNEKDFEQAEDIQQYGRSASSLSAERAAASLRNEDGTLDKSASAPHGPKIPSISPPPEPTSSLSSGDKKADSDTQSRPSDETKSSQSRSYLAVPASPGRRRSHPRTPLPPLRGPSRNSASELLGIEGRRLSNPLTLRDLGSDYTRYFSPIDRSARSSMIETSIAPSSRPNLSTRATTPFSSSNPFATPNASTTRLSEKPDPERTASVIEKLTFLVDDRLTAPYEEEGASSWPLIGDKAEDDDEMHMPRPDDDIRFRPKWSDPFSRANIVSTIGMIFMILGLVFIFIVLPIISYVGIIDYTSGYSTPLDQMPKAFRKPESWAHVNDLQYPLLQNMRSTLIDPDTPEKYYTKEGAFGEEFELVFSDEFNDNNRTFYEGDDPYWFAPDIWYGATRDLDWYDPDAVTTWDGTLELRLDRFRNHGLNYRSGMLNSWNQLCFKGGIFEVSVSLPGPANVFGLWPGAWTMGNLGRPGYLSTTEGMWPYTYNSCDAGITPNQSSYDGLSQLPGQKLSSCTCPGEDHPTPGRGRGAPEIDIFEAGASYTGLPIVTQSYQVAPFDIWYYPDYEFTEFPDYSISYTNGYTGGPFQQAISATTNINSTWYDGIRYQRYSFEYEPGEGEDAYIVWKVGGETTFKIDGRAIGPNGNIKQRQISEEPMSLVLNLGFSESWTWIDWLSLRFPTVMRVDYVRWYQKKGSTSVTCDPPGFETTQYINDHINAYTNPNFTKWDQTGHAWPKHKLNSDC
ncbi:beta-glucan synthesis-associated [Lojkania enalia]|uniref:Beta-glucan synthesis-associated n=1 Tax=Lojkania enalia TaxID=147567 RepID=A0A9P4N788_9PLEO|nr:beta-glucan synthesis-associated [Didymosphaeria enalia]